MQDADLSKMPHWRARWSAGEAPNAETQHRAPTLEAALENIASWARRYSIPGSHNKVVIDFVTPKEESK